MNGLRHLCALAGFEQILMASLARREPVRDLPLSVFGRPPARPRQHQFNVRSPQGIHLLCSPLLSFLCPLSTVFSAASAAASPALREHANMCSPTRTDERAVALASLAPPEAALELAARAALLVSAPRGAVAFWEW